MLCSIFVGRIMEASLGSMDDVNMLREDEKDIVVADVVCRAFEEASVPILNRNFKAVTLGLGSWEGHQVEPLPWLQAVQQAKVYRVMVAPPVCCHPGRLLGPCD